MDKKVGANSNTPNQPPKIWLLKTILACILETVKVSTEFNWLNYGISPNLFLPSFFSSNFVLEFDKWNLLEWNTIVLLFVAITPIAITFRWHHNRLAISIIFSKNRWEKLQHHDMPLCAIYLVLFSESIHWKWMHVTSF